MSSVNKINFSYFKNNKEQVNEDNIIFSGVFTNQLSFIVNNNSYFWDFNGFKIIKCQNTNKTIRNLLVQNNVESFIQINSRYIKTSDILIISAFTKVSDILSSKTNHNVHNYLKENSLFQINSDIEKFIVAKLNGLDDKLKNLVDYDLSKCDLINYMDINDEYINENNIIDILEIIKTYDKKKLIILNDVDFLKLNKIIDYLAFFNILYFVNWFDDSYKRIENYQDYLIEYDCLLLNQSI